MSDWPQTPIDLGRARHPGEKSAATVMAVGAAPMGLLLALYVVVTLGLVGIVFAMIVGFMMVVEMFMLAGIRANGVRVGPAQYPELNRMIENFSGRLGIERPEVYLMQDSMWNAFAARLGNRRVVVLLSGAVDSLLLDGEDDDLAFLVGHELGHIAAGHLEWKHRLLRLGAWVPWVAPWHRRCMELTCDRIAIACCGDGAIALRGLCGMTVGGLMASRTNIDAAIAQWREVRSSLFVTLKTMYSMYPHNLWRIEEARDTALRWGLMEAIDGETGPVFPSNALPAPSRSTLPRGAVAGVASVAPPREPVGRASSSSHAEWRPGPDDGRR